MNIQHLKFCDIRPNVRYVNLLQCVPGFVEGPRRIYDHQIVYVHKGKGRMEIGGEIFNALPGDLFFYGPGTTHAFYADDSDPYLLSGIHFDFTDNFTNKPHPIGPFALESYNSELITESVKFTDFPGLPVQMNFCSDTKIRDIILEMVHEYNFEKTFSREYINRIFSVLLILTGRKVLLDNTETVSKDNIIENVMKYIHEHYYENLTNKSIAAKFHFHQNYLNELMVAYTGVPLRQYIINFRIRKALDMLLHTKMNISDISISVGYRDTHYFSRIFKKKTGLTPIQISRPQDGSHI